MVTEKFNHDHYRRVREARNDTNLPVGKLNIPLKNHQFVDRKLYDKEENEVYTIESVHKHWYSGWYIVLLIVDCAGSSCLLFWENINCMEELIINGILENNKRYSFIDTVSFEEKISKRILSKNK